MTSRELTRKILLRLKRFLLLIILGGLITGAVAFLYAHYRPIVYTVRSSLFPLTTSQDNSPSSKIKELLGEGSSKSISDDANVSIEEVARSEKTRAAVVEQRLPAYGNKTIAEVLIKEYNAKRSFTQRAISMPAYDSDIISKGARLLQDNFSIKFNKNNLLEMYFSSTDKNLVVPVSYLLIDKISGFYKELKTEKAKADFDFIDAKVDSLDRVLHDYDRRMIAMNNTTLFVPYNKLQYAIPKENINFDKTRVLGQRTGVAADREEALWRLQKVTPIIKVLDKPTPPFTEDKPSGAIYGIVGFLAGFFFFSLICISRLLYRYASEQVEEALADKTVAENNINTTA